VRVLFDTNIVLDYLLDREPFSEDAEGLFNKIAEGKIVGYVTATTLTDIFYIANRHTRNIDLTRQALSTTLSVMEICPVNRVVLETAFASGLEDFEDAVQIACATTQGLETIVTRDIRGFSTATIPVLNARQLLEELVP
jgi:predicted nucleic acid-binding protein